MQADMNIFWCPPFSYLYSHLFCIVLLFQNSRNNHHFALTSNITKNKSFTEFLPTPLIFFPVFDRLDPGTLHLKLGP